MRPESPDQSSSSSSQTPVSTGFHTYDIAAQEPAAKPSRKMLFIVVAIVVILLIASVAAAAAALWPRYVDGDASVTRASFEDMKSGSEAEPPLELTKYTDDKAGFSMSVPTVIDMQAEADEVFEGMYTVSGSMGTDYGNRFVTINKEVYPEALSQEYDVWLKEELDRQQELMDIAEERQNVKTKRTFGEIADIAGYSGNRIRIEETETSTKNPGESHTKVSEHLLIYINPTVVYRVELQGSADDKAFMAVLDEMMASFTLK